MSFLFLQRLRTIILLLIIGLSVSLAAHQAVLISHASVPGKSVGRKNARVLELGRNPSIDERNVFILVNFQRKKKGLASLKWSNDLGKMARKYSKKMARENFFDHYDSEGMSVVDRAEQSEITDWTKIGENLFFSEGYISSSALAVKGWLDSPPHRHNMFDKGWTHTGIGISEIRRKTYVTQVFLTR